MDVSVNIYDDTTLGALLCYFLTHGIHMSMNVIHVSAALLSSGHALHISSSTYPTMIRENSIDGL